MDPDPRTGRDGDVPMSHDRVGGPVPGPQDLIRAPHGPCYADLRGKVALVTGGGRGIGRGLSLRLGVEGMRVVVCGRTEQTLAETVGLIEAAGGTASAQAVDVSSEEQVASLLASVRERYGRLDLLVHNAAMMEGRTLAATDTDHWRRAFATNMESAYHLAQGSLPLMPRGGSMVFVSTVGALQAHYGMVAYDSSKGALETFIRALALELAPQGLRVNGIAPGATDHDAHAAEIPAARLVHRFVPMGRRGTPAEMAAAVAFLASDQASYITGQILRIDGGATAQLSPRGCFI